MTSLPQRQRPLLRVTARRFTPASRRGARRFRLPEALANWIAYRLYWPRTVEIDPEIEIVNHWRLDADLLATFPICHQESTNWEVAEELAEEFKRQTHRTYMIQINVIFAERDLYLIAYEPE